MVEPNERTQGTVQRNVKNVDKYDIYQDENLGNGSYGSVLKGRNKLTGEIVAIKVVDTGKLSMNQDDARMFAHEAEALFALKDFTNENLVRTIEVMRSARHIYFIMELCNGGDLESYLIKKYGKPKQKTIPPVPEEDVREIFNDIINGFRTLQSLNIIHRDIKPTNILLGNGRWKIADFGFAKRLKDQNYTGTTVGTPFYAAPQILESAPGYTNKCDIWSLGVMLYECLCGEYPFQASSVEELKRKINQGKINFPPSVVLSDEIKNLILKMLVKDEKQRIDWPELFEFKFVETFDVEEGNVGVNKALPPLSKADAFSPRMLLLNVSQHH
eukprot:TRINITY_DN13004_c0_g1_i2.p1 TRINITY_DN13004_c0_g1~~TRINITY_DN13004_c0_g1_i2.p1  ORF type:complete len:329 (+),score=50.34 TRINITY_DN13004_c0_g1_i2:57-1043(+)